MKETNFIAGCVVLFTSITAITPSWAESTCNKTLFDRVDLQAQSSREIDNDLMQVTLSVQKEDKNPARLADEINQTMSWALQTARASKDVIVKSGSYQTYPVYQANGNTVGHWRATQQILLESTNTTTLTTLIGQLQTRLQIEAMGFAVSPGKRREAENSLIEAALAAFKTRADIVRANLNATSYRIINISVNTSGEEFRRPVAAMAEMSLAKTAAPAVEAGSSQVTVSVSGTVQLK